MLRCGPGATPWAAGVADALAGHPDVRLRFRPARVIRLGSFRLTRGTSADEIPRPLGNANDQGARVFVRDTITLAGRWREEAAG
jgi:hypothetical protein